MENYKIQNFEISLSFSCFAQYDIHVAAVFKFFIVSEEVSTVAVYFVELKFTE